MNTVAVNVPAAMEAAVKAFVEQKQREEAEAAKARFAPGARVRVVAEGEVTPRGFDPRDGTVHVRSSALLGGSEWVRVAYVQPLDESAPTTPAATDRPLAVGDEVYIKARVLGTGSSRSTIEIDTPEVGYKPFSGGAFPWRLENRQLLRSLPVAPTTPTAADMDAELRRMASSDKIGAIKRCRELTSMGLKEAKDYVEALCRPEQAHYESGARVWVAATIARHDDGDNTYKVDVIDFTGDTERVDIWLKPSILRPRHE